jgi:hypothetical protein
MSIKNTIKMEGRSLIFPNQPIYLPTSRVISISGRRIRAQLSPISGAAIQSKRLARQQDVAS